LQPGPHPKAPSVDSSSPILKYAIQSPANDTALVVKIAILCASRCRLFSCFYLLIRGGLLACACCSCSCGCCVGWCGSVVCGTWPPFILFSSLRFFSLTARISSLSFLSVVSASSTMLIVPQSHATIVRSDELGNQSRDNVPCGTVVT